MKKIFTPLLLLASFISSARPTGITIPTLYPHFGSSQPSNNTGGYNIRLLAIAKATSDGTTFLPFDSSTYSYSNGREGLLDLDYTDNFVKYDDKYYYEFNKQVNSYQNKSHYKQSFNVLSNVESVLEQEWAFVNGQYQWHNKLNLEYIYGNDLTQLIRTNEQLWSGFWWEHVNYELEYDSRGDIVTIDFNTNITSLKYDQNHNIIERKEYSYDQSTGWGYSVKYSFVYDNANVMTSHTIEQFSNGMWTNNKKVDYNYSGNVLLNTIEHTWSNGAWQPNKRITPTYDINNNKLMEEYESWDGASASFVNAKKLVWSYNPQNQPTSYYSFTWDVTSKTWMPKTGDFMYHYYYEFYFPTSVPELPKAADLFTMYPVPANNVVTVQLKRPSAEKYDGYIYDMQGKIVRTFEIGAKENVPVENLPSGNYMIGILYENKKLAQPLVVAH